MAEDETSLMHNDTNHVSVCWSEIGAEFVLSQKCNNVNIEQKCQVLWSRPTFGNNIWRKHSFSKNKLNGYLCTSYNLCAIVILISRCITFIKQCLCALCDCERFADYNIKCVFLLTILPYKMLNIDFPNT